MKTVADREAARELKLYAANNRDVYFNGVIPLVKNLAKKAHSGRYNGAKAVRGWENVVEYAAKLYAQEFADIRDWYRIFNAATRHETAKGLMEYFSDHLAEAVAGMA